MSVTSDPRRAWATAARRLALALLAFALLPACFLACYLLMFGAPGSAMLPHLGVLAGVLTALAGLRLWLRLVPVGARARRAAAAAFLVATGLAMFAFYAAVLLGLQYWGRVTTLDLVGTYAPQAGELMRALGHRPEWVAAAVTVVVALAWFGADRYLKAHDWLAPLEPTLAPPVMAALGLLLLAFAAVSAAELPSATGVRVASRSA